MTKTIDWIGQYAARLKRGADLIFIVSALALALLWSFSIYDLFTNEYVVNLSTIVINLFVFTPLIAWLVWKYGLIRMCAANITPAKLLGCGGVAAWLAVRLAGRGHEKIYYDILLGGRGPQNVRTLFALLPLQPETAGGAIRYACMAAGALAIPALLMAFLLLCEFIAWLLQKPRLYLFGSADGDVDGTGIAGADTAGADIAGAADVNDVTPPPVMRKHRRAAFGLLALTAAVMVAFSQAQSFWFDELVYTIGKVAGAGFVDLSRALLEEGYNMPLYYYAIVLIYPFVPYGEGYLLIVSIAAVVAGIVFVYFAAGKIGGGKMAIIALSFASLSSLLMTRGAWELRPYPFIFCFSAMTLWFYFARMKNDKWGHILLYGVAMAFLFYSHWFGGLLLFFHGICDMILWVRGKIRPRFICSYLLAGAAVMPWMVLMSINLKSDLSVNVIAWTPKWLSIVNTLDILLSSNSLLWLILAAAVAIILVAVMEAVKAKAWNVNLWLWLQTLLGIFWVIGTVFIYSRYVNPAGAIYMDRYFFVLAPHVLLLTAFGMKCLGEFFVRPSARVRCLTFLLALVGLVGYYGAISSVMRIHQPYREVAGILARTPEAYQEGTAVLTSAGNESWLEYYFRKRGFAIPANVAFGLDLIVKDGEMVRIPLTYEELYQYERIFVWYCFYEIPPEFTKTWQDEETGLALYQK